ncbi:MAG: HNH endonuclease [Verrucomicrobiota bacterium]|nr:HNH endonuclease [Verrucomicrobiota bacterium]
MHVAIDQPVLVLNRLWQAINICSVKRAFTLLYQGHATVVSEQNGNFQTFTFNQWQNFSDLYDGNEIVKTISFRVRIPRVIILLGFDRLPKKEVKFTRHNIFERDKNQCQYCGNIFERKDLNLDHVLPRHQGGPTTWENIVCSCVPCNTRKGNRTPIQAGLRLVKKPKKPKWRPFINVNLAIHHESWRHFIDFAYWNVELGQELS